MPKVSVIVPVYKVEKYLERCLDSLIHQTLNDIEIILVDDGSPDGSPAICDKYAENDARIKVIHKENEGVSAARNDGLKDATGEWVIFCDSDDWLELDGLDLLYQTGLRNQVDVVVGDIFRIKGHEIIYNRYFANEFTYRNRTDMDNLVMADIYQNYCATPPKTHTIGYGGPWNKLVRRDLLKKFNICFDTSLMGIFDDILYTAYVYANMGSISYIQKPVYNYVMATTSLTKGYNSNSLEINNRIFKAFSSFIKKYAPDGKWDKAYDAMVIRRFEEALRFYFFNANNPSKLSERLKELREVMKTEPYSSASQNVDLNKLISNHKRVAILLKAHSDWGLWLLYKIKNVMGRN